jgi:hypothetical protein
VGIEPEPASVIDELDQACTLSRKQARAPRWPQRTPLFTP